MSRIVRLSVLTALLVMLSGCGAGAGEPDTAVTGNPTGPGPTGPMSSPTAELVTPRPGVQDAQPVNWDEVRIIDQNTIEVEWWSGVAPCDVLDHVEVTTGAEAIRVTLFEGSAADPDQACIELAVRKRTRIDLEEPVAGREIVDGADPPGTATETG